VSFRAPILLLTLLALPALLAFLAALRRRPGPRTVAFTNLALLAEVAPSPGRAWRRVLPVALFLLSVAAAAAASARPQARLTTAARHATVVLLVDVSGSMSARDVEPTRLDAATAAMRTFLDRLPPSVDVGLVDFSTEPEILQRPTADRDLVRERLGYLVPEAGTAIGDALATAATLFHRPGGAIVLLSDGSQTRGRLGALQGAARARAKGIRVDTIALGTPRGRVGYGGLYQPVPPDPPLMHAIAKATGGRSFTAPTAERLTQIYAHLDGRVVRRTSTRELTSWFALASAVLLVGALALSQRLGGALA